MHKQLIRVSLLSVFLTPSLGLIFCSFQEVRAGTPYAQSRSQFNHTMAVERANTQAIRDSVKFVNRAQQDTRTNWSQPIIDAMNHAGVAESAKDDWARAAQYEKLQHTQKVNFLSELASSGYTPAQVELGVALLNGELGLKADARKALKHLLPAAEKGDAIAAYNVGLSYQRINEDAAAIPYFEQAAAAKVEGASYKVTMAALLTRDFDKVILYGKQATLDKSAIGAYAVCLAGEFKKDAGLRAEYCKAAYQLGYLDAAEDAGISLAQVGKWDSAYEYFMKCVERINNLSCQRNAGIAAFKLKHFDEALERLSKAIENGDKDETAVLVLEDIRMEKASNAIYGSPADWNTAERFLMDVISSKGKREPEAHFYMGMVLANQEKTSKENVQLQLDSHIIAAARGGYKPAQQMLKDHDMAW